MRIALLVALAFVACNDGPPKRLVPAGAKVIRELPRREEHCYVHRAWTMTASAEATAKWATDNDLPCVDDAKPCVHWSTEKRKDPFWKNARTEPRGLDTLDARLGNANGQLTVDWGDYTCSGPN
jgi:hypothetical protein